MLWKVMALGFCAIGASTYSQELDYQHGISLLHELKYPIDYQHFEYANPNAPKGGKIVLSTTSPIVNFNGARGPELPNAVGLGRTLDRLLIRSADELSGLYGQLAEGIALTHDHKSLYFKLHDHAQWHDGVPVTTDDIQFTYDELMAAVHGKVYFNWMKSLEVLGPKDFVVHHKETFTNSNLVSMTWFPVRPAHYWKDRDPRKATLDPPVASGPYRVKDFGRSFVSYERVDEYWGRDIPVNRGRFNFDEIRYEVYRDQSVAREAFRKGLFDIMFETDIRHWVSSYDIPEIAEQRILQQTREVRKFIGSERSIALNTRRPHLSDVRVREALVLAFDFEWQNRVMRHGTQRRAASYFENSRFASAGLPSEAELKLLRKFEHQLDPRVFNTPYTMPVSTGYGTNRDALSRSQDLLAQAGWHLQDGVLVDDSGNPFTFEILTHDPNMQRVLLPYADTLKRLGIDARMRLVDNVTGINLRRSRNFDSYVREHLFLNPPVGELRSHFNSQSAQVEMGANLTGTNSEVVDALVEEAMYATSLNPMIDAVKALDRVLLWGFYHIQINRADLERFLYWDKFERPSGEAVANLEHMVGSSVRVLDSWWISNSTDTGT